MVGGAVGLVGGQDCSLDFIGGEAEYERREKGESSAEALVRMICWAQNARRVWKRVRVYW